MVHRRELKGETLTFGNQGALWGNAMTWWDHDTGSIWSQPLGEAIVGSRKGARLELYPSTLTTWSSWKDSHPKTLALDVHAWATGFELSQMAIVINVGTETMAYLVPALREARIVNDTVAGLDVAVVVDPEVDGRWAVFSRQLDNSIAELEIALDGLIDTASGTIFDSFTGAGISGPLADQALARIPAFTLFPDDYLTFFPHGNVWSG